MRKKGHPKGRLDEEEKAFFEKRLESIKQRREEREQESGKEEEACENGKDEQEKS